jgi:hypothetical protein
MVDILHRVGVNTTVLFKYEGWQEPVEFMHHCSTKWAAPRRRPHR